MKRPIRVKLRNAPLIRRDGMKIGAHARMDVRNSDDNDLQFPPLLFNISQKNGIAKGQVIAGG